jgi:hypothetical protein
METNTVKSTPPEAKRSQTIQVKPKVRAQASQLITELRKQLETAGTTRMQEVKITTIETAKIYNFLRALKGTHELQ